ncbi:hypothetical protein C8R46DRAFT_439428 [Mycena filopes]|nr:hypothetical protein C8R46DRAFT_439428 [Mycena filopes]
MRTNLVNQVIATILGEFVCCTQIQRASVFYTALTAAGSHSMSTWVVSILEALLICVLVGSHRTTPLARSRNVEQRSRRI